MSRKPNEIQFEKTGSHGPLVSVQTTLRGGYVILQNDVVTS